MPDPLDMTLDLEACANEPIHTPGAIQSHGALIALDEQLRIRETAGDLERMIGWSGNPSGRRLVDLLRLDEDVLASAGGASEASFIGTIDTEGARCDAFAHRSGARLILELEPAAVPASAAPPIGSLYRLTKPIAEAGDVGAACAAAATAVRQVIDYDRVMIYRFLEDESGAVIAEDRIATLSPFLHHHYPASDIPRQARALYLRNPVRVIPDVDYQPAPLQDGEDPLDISGALLRSVSPVHIQYLKNMDVAASASFSIVQDEALWGLIACHHGAPKGIGHEQREMCRHLGLVLEQAIGRLEEENSQREALRLTRRREELLPLIAAAHTVADGLCAHVEDLRRLIPSDGVVVVTEDAVHGSGVVPPDDAIRPLVEWLIGRCSQGSFATRNLARDFAFAQDYSAQTSGVLCALVSRSPVVAIAWCRAEEVEIVNWAGNPHKPIEPGCQPGQLSPRKSFEKWVETVRNQSRPWRDNEQDAARRIAAGLAEVMQQKSAIELNRQLRSAVLRGEEALAEKDLLMREVHHRVQNSLQLVTSMLQLQGTEVESEIARDQLQLARERILSVAMLHRRLWRSEDLESANLDTFLAELVDALVGSWGKEWQGRIRLDASPLRLPSRETLLLALIVTELLTNAVKHAYGGAPGPIELVARERGKQSLTVTVTDQGVGSAAEGRPGSFGSKLVQRLVRQMGGTLEVTPNEPGTRVALVLPR